MVMINIVQLKTTQKYSTTQEFNKLTLENFTARLKQVNLASKSYIANFVKKTHFDNKI